MGKATSQINNSDMKSSMDLITQARQNNANIASLQTQVDNNSSALAEIAYNAKNFGAKGDGVTDDTNAINQAITAAMGKTLFLPSGTYKISSGLSINGSINIVGQGDSTVIKSTDTVNSVLSVSNANGSVFSGFAITSTVTARNTTQVALKLSNSNQCVIENIWVYQTVAGIMVYNCSDCKVFKNDIRNTYADGIHVTHQSKNIVVSGNTTYNTGDDSIAVVSYQGDGGLCTQILITDNVLNSSKARGITHVGGNNVTIANNIINGTASSGILVLRDSAYNTYSPSNTIISKNQILAVGTVTPNAGNQFGIEVTADSVSCRVEGNIIRDGTNRGFDIGGSLNVITGNTVTNQSDCQLEQQSGVVFANNRIESCTGNGLAVINNTDATIIGNTFFNNNTSGAAAKDNLFVSGCTRVNIVGNFSIDTNAIPKVRNAMTIYNNTDVQLSGNKLDCGTLGVSFITTTKVLVLDGINSTSDPTDTTTYSSGQKWYNTSNNNFWIFNGTSWQTTGINSNNPTFTGTLKSSTITTGNTQVINPLSNVIYFGNPNTPMFLQSNGLIDCTTNTLNANILKENNVPLSTKYAPFLLASAPASATATGTTGQMAQDGNYFYLCVATNTWKRTAIASW